MLIFFLAVVSLTLCLHTLDHKESYVLLLKHICNIIPSVTISRFSLLGIGLHKLLVKTISKYAFQLSFVSSTNPRYFTSLENLIHFMDVFFFCGSDCIVYCIFVFRVVRKVNLIRKYLQITFPKKAIQNKIVWWWWY